MPRHDEPRNPFRDCYAVCTYHADHIEWTIGAGTYAVERVHGFVGPYIRLKLDFDGEAHAIPLGDAAELAAAITNRIADLVG